MEAEEPGAEGGTGKHSQQEHQQVPDIHGCKDEASRKRVIRDAFSLFDMDQQGVIPEAEVPTVMRYLGMFPTQKEVIRDILPAMQGDEPSDVVHYDSFEKVILGHVENNDYAPDSEERLLQAFRVR